MTGRGLLGALRDRCLRPLLCVALMAAASAQEKGLLVFPWGPEVISLVTHQNFPETSLAPALEILAGVLGGRR